MILFIERNSLWGDRMKERINNFIQHIGYFSTVTSLPEFSVYFLPVNGNAEVVVTIDYQKEIYLTEEIYFSIREKFVQSFKEQGFGNVHIITLVLCKEPERIEEIFRKDNFSWYIDVKRNVLIIPKGHVEDFYGFKKKVEEFLGDSEKYTEEFIDKRTLKNINKEKRRFKDLPFINVAIIIINILVFILCAFMPEVLYNKGAFSILLIQETKEYYRFLTAVFMHVDLDHLLSNMVVLYFLGNGLETKVGHIKYVILYFSSAIGGNLLSAVYENYYGNMFTSVGASGAIFGVIAAVFILIIVKGGRWENITLPRMLLMIAYSLYSGFMSENVNNAGHIGGFVAGLLIMIFYCVIERLHKKKEVSHEN